MSPPFRPGNAPDAIAWHALEHVEVCDLLQVTPEVGLSETEASQRLADFGPNSIEVPRGANLWAKIPEQVASPAALLLLGASLASYLLNRVVEGTAVLLSVLLTVIPSLVLILQNGRNTPRNQLHLARMARVRRDGRLRIINPVQLVPGDVIHLTAGDLVPADARLTASISLRLQEERLTGSRHAVDKVPQAVRSGRPGLHERHNLVYAGTTVLHGRGEAIVIQTGMSTELGRLVQPGAGGSSRPTLLAFGLQLLNNQVAAVLLGTFAISLGMGMLRAERPANVLYGWAALAVAAIPASLPLAVFLFLKRGEKNLFHRHTPVRAPQVLETLGKVTAICTDQSGPLTENQLTLEIQDAAGKNLVIDQPLFRGQPLLAEDSISTSRPLPAHSLLLTAAALSGQAVLRPEDGPGSLTAASGDPLEGAVLVAAARIGLWKERLDRLYPRLLSAPYTRDRGRQSALHEVRLTPHVNTAELPLASLLSRQSPFVIVSTGRLASLLSTCDRVWENGHILPLDTTRLEEIQSSATAEDAGTAALLGVAFRPLDRLPALVEDYPLFSQGFRAYLGDVPLGPRDLPQDVGAADELERNLIYIGHLKVIENPREGAARAVTAGRELGVRPVLFTQEAPEQAAETALRLRITALDSPRVLRGPEIDQLSPADLETAAGSTSIYSQVSPQQRVRIVRALQRRGEVVAITGEGASDSPAMISSDLGAGIVTGGAGQGSPVAGIQLLDGSYAALISAVEEGRAAYLGIRRFLGFSLSRSVGLLLVLICAPLISFRAAFTPLQVLMLNLLSDLLVGVPIGFALQGRSEERGRGLRQGESLVAGDESTILWGALGIALLGAAAAGFSTRFDLRFQGGLVFWTIAAGTAWSAGFSIGSGWISRNKKTSSYPWIWASGVIIFLCLTAAAVSWAPAAGWLGLTTLPAGLVAAGFLASSLMIPWLALLHSKIKKARG